MGMLTHLLITNSNTGILWQLLFALSFGDCQCERYRGERGQHLQNSTYTLIWNIRYIFWAQQQVIIKKKKKEVKIHLKPTVLLEFTERKRVVVCFFPSFLKQSSAHPGYTAVWAKQSHKCSYNPNIQCVKPLWNVAKRQWRRQFFGVFCCIWPNPPPTRTSILVVDWHISGTAR